MIRATDDASVPPIATGSRESLSEAIEAAERAMAAFDSTRQDVG